MFLVTISFEVVFTYKEGFKLGLLCGLGIYKSTVAGYKLQ